jgi:NDP-sugar pyrophosphorylase family protein
MKAVILAAGRGTRLRPYTDSLPKCLVPLNGTPILQRQIEALDRAGVRDCILVVGYLSAEIRALIGQRWGGVRVSYVENPRYHETNNLYSLWLARKEMDDDILLLEGDLVFDEGLLLDLSRSPYADAAVVDVYRSSMEGTVVIAAGGVANAMVLKSAQPAGFDYSAALKTVNIYRLSQATLARHFLPELDRFVTNGQVNQFYEAALAELIDQGRLRLGVHLPGTRRWAEIDTVEDLVEARRIFQPTVRAGDAVGASATVATPSGAQRHERR